MRPITLTLIATAVIGLSLFCCKKSPEPCWDTCPFPRRCKTYDCSCPQEMFFYANMCLHNNNNKYIAMLPEGDFLDTFALMVGKGLYAFTPQSNPFSGVGSALSYYEFSTYDSIFIFNFPRHPLRSTDPVVDGWPTLNGKKFLFYFHGIIKHENRDTLYARLRWIGLGSGEDLQAPVDFKMHIPKRD
jgi:hypothetical protein